RAPSSIIAQVRFRTRTNARAIRASRVGDELGPMAEPWAFDDCSDSRIHRSDIAIHAIAITIGAIHRASTRADIAGIGCLNAYRGAARSLKSLSLLGVCRAKTIRL